MLPLISRSSEGPSASKTNSKHVLCIFICPKDLTVGQGLPLFCCALLPLRTQVWGEKVPGHDRGDGWIQVTVSETNSFETARNDRKVNINQLLKQIVNSLTNCLKMIKQTVQTMKHVDVQFWMIHF